MSLNSSVVLPMATAHGFLLVFRVTGYRRVIRNGANLKTVLCQVGMKEERDQRDSLTGPAGKTSLPSIEWPGSIVLLQMSVFG